MQQGYKKFILLFILYLSAFFRRRRWVRHCRLNFSGPWDAAGSLELIDVSIQVDKLVSDTDPLVLWAVGANGNALCRQGVTTRNPVGDGWIHVPTALDKPFKSISVGGSFRLWGVASDGSAWYRAGITCQNPAGSRWLQVVPPPSGNAVLHQVSVGESAVWAVDTTDNLWRRENVTYSFPEGTGWVQVASCVKQVSVGPSDQVYIVAKSGFGRGKHAGVVYKRAGITETKPSGNEWKTVIGHEWAHVSVRGNHEQWKPQVLLSMMIAQKGSIPV